MVKDNIENPCSSYDVVVDTINNNGVYVNDKNVDVYEVDVQPDLQEKTVEYTENGEYLLNLLAKINVSIPNSSTAVTITENGTTTLRPDSGYFNQVDINVDVPASKPELETKEVTIIENGTETIRPDSAYGLSEVIVHTEIPNTSTAVTINQNGTTTLTPESGYYNEVTVNTNVQPPLQEKELSLGINERSEVTPDTEYYGLSKVVVQSPDVPLQNKTLNVTENGSTRLMPDEGYYALHTVDVNVNVPNPELESKTIEITQNGSTYITPDSKYGLSSVTVNTNVQPALQNKTVEYTENGQYSVTNDDGFYGLKQAKINVSIPNVSTAVTITENGTTILTPDNGYYNQVNIDVQVPDPELESKTIDITENGTMNITPDSAYGLSNVTVNTNVQPPLQEKEILIGINERKEITPDTEYYGLSKVTVQSPDVPLQNKDITITQNGSTRLMPDEGYYALHTVDVNVNVPNPELESKTVSITNNGTTNIAPDSKYGLSNVTVNTNVQPNLQNKDVTISKNGTQTITKDNGYDGLGNVTVTTNVEGGGSIGNYIKIQTPFKGTSIIQCINGTLDITKWDLRIENYYHTFYNLNYLNKIILPIDFFYQENKNDVLESWTFKNCTHLAEIENIDKTRISLNRFDGTFSNCTSLTSLDLSYKPEYNYWDMSGVENMETCFEDCSNLTTLNIDGWDRAKLSYSYYMFSNCYKLGGIIRLGAHNAIRNNYTFKNCKMIDEIYYDNDGYDNEAHNYNDLCNMLYFAYGCTNLKKASIKGRRVHQEDLMFGDCTNIEWVDMTGCDYSKYMSGYTSTSNVEPYRKCTKLKTLIGDHTLQEVENGDITIYDGLGLSQPRFSSYYFSPLSSLRYSSMLAIAKGLGEHTYTSTQYIRFNTTAWANMRNDDDTIPDSDTITARQTIITDLITSKGWSIQTATS